MALAGMPGVRPQPWELDPSDPNYVPIPGVAPLADVMPGGGTGGGAAPAPPVGGAQMVSPGGFALPESSHKEEITDPSSTTTTKTLDPGQADAIGDHTAGVAQEQGADKTASALKVEGLGNELAGASEEDVIRFEAEQAKARAEGAARGDAKPGLHVEGKAHLKDGFTGSGAAPAAKAPGNYWEQQDAARQEAAAQAAAAARSQTIAAKQAALDAARREEMARSTFKTGWADQDMPTRLLGIWLGGLSRRSQALSGGGDGPTPFDTRLEQAFAADKEHKLNLFQQAQNKRKLAERDVGLAQEKLAAEIQRIDTQQTIQLAQLNRRIQIEAKRLAIPEAQAAAAKVDALAQQKDAAFRATQLKGLETEHVARSGTRSVSDTENANKGGAAGQHDLSLQNLKGKVVGRAKSPAEAKDINAAWASAHDMHGAITEYKAIVAEATRLGRYLPEHRRRLDGLQQRIIGGMSEAGRTGTLNAGEFPRYQGVLEPKFWESGDAVVSVLGDLDRSIGRGYNNKLGSQGVSAEAPAATRETAPPPAAAKSEKAAPAKSGTLTNQSGRASDIQRLKDWIRANPNADPAKRAAAARALSAAATARTS